MSDRPNNKQLKLLERSKEIEDIRNFFDVPSHMLLIGTTISGKSHFFRYWLYCMRQRFTYGLVFCSTIDVDPLEFVPRKYQYKEFDEQVVENLVNKQYELIKSYGKKDAPQVFIYLDDICGIISRKKGMETLNKLFSAGRHYNISVIASVQSATMLSPTIRSNSRYYLITLTSGSNIEYIWEHCARGYENKRSFKADLDFYCHSWQVLVYDTHGTNTTFRKLYKAPKVVRYYFDY